LDPILTSGWLDFVPRSGEFTPIAVGLQERRMRQARYEEVRAENAQAEDFGELLRHELNNPLTGILGNAELLLARRERLPPGAVERLETIAELAVRLRETVRRLSNTWMEQRDQIRSA
jgi:signal transduction histidine kinase